MKISEKSLFQLEILGLGLRIMPDFSFLKLEILSRNINQDVNDGSTTWAWCCRPTAAYIIGANAFWHESGIHHFLFIHEEYHPMFALFFCCVLGDDHELKIAVHIGMLAMKPTSA